MSTARRVAPRILTGSLIELTTSGPTLHEDMVSTVLPNGAVTQTNGIVELRPGVWRTYVVVELHFPAIGILLTKDIEGGKMR